MPTITLLAEPRPVIGLTRTLSQMNLLVGRPRRASSGDLLETSPPQESVKEKKNIKKSSSAERPVSKLRPKVPISMKDTDSILMVAQAMAARRADAALLTDDKGQLSGIITDNDITRRVIALFVDPTASVETVMTKHPKCVNEEDSALDALEMMVDNRFRHLPVLDKTG
jgi:signal-transduction protein with cAMP-binding, CBS, and nucleotidyltransferase domain